MIILTNGTVFNHSFDYLDDPNCPTYTIKEMKMENPKTKLTMCAVYDNKVKEYGQIMSTKTLDEAIRSFGAAARQEGHQFKSFASDFSLWQIGYYYPETGEIENIVNMQVSLATDFN